ncbi:MAG: alpha/beta fold hydrolase [Chloroflexi bacterium]|nr:alpha/beta fold hydrolase [Chloroflexota bacterium]
MAFTENLATWLLNQLEMLPSSILHDKTQVSRRVLDQFYGEREAAELAALLQQPAEGGDRALTVLLPGIMGSLLSSIRGISAMLWINTEVFLNGQINLLELDDAGTADRSPDVEIAAVGMEKLYYLSLIVALANRTHLFEFPYDWRYANERSAEQLHRALLRWSAGYPDQKFVLIGHSMGGLVIRTYLALYPAEAEKLVGKVILLASPLYGSPLAITYLAGSAPNEDFGAKLNPANDLVRLISTLPSMYQLLPPPRELFRPSRYYPADWDLYDASAWGIATVRQEHLDGALAMYKLLDQADPQIPITQIAGNGYKTMTDVRREVDGIEVRFTSVYHQVNDQGGDEQVPLYSSWDARLTTYFVDEHHRQIPGNTLVHQAVLDLIDDRRPALPQVPLVTPLLKLPASTTLLLHQFQDFRQRLEQGTFTREDISRLFPGISD